MACVSSDGRDETAVDARPVTPVNHRRSLLIRRLGCRLEQVLEEALRSKEEAARHGIVLGLFEASRRQTIPVQSVDESTRVRHEDGRVGGHDELAPLLYEVVHYRQRRELALGGERRFWLVEDVKTVRREAVLEQPEEGLTVGLLV